MFATHKGIMVGMNFVKRLPCALMGLVLLGMALPVVAADVLNSVDTSEGDLPDVTVPDDADTTLTGGERDKKVKLPGVTMTVAKTTNLMDKGPQCMKYKWTSEGVCCGWKLKKVCGLGGCKCISPYCVPGYSGGRFDIQFWEPTEVIEVSCRTGYSMLAPGAVPSRLSNYVEGSGDAAKMPQSCFGANSLARQKWFFEARVWTINGDDEKLRHQAMGEKHGARAKQCTMAGKDVPWANLPGDRYWGYGKRWGDFNRGSPNGPQGSWEAYISDSDPSWALETSGQASPKTLSECKAGTNDMDNCWGPVTENGWVVHSNPKVAAALVAWRAHEKAQKAKKAAPLAKPVSGHKFSFEKNKFQMMMDYPYLDYAGPHGASMGMKNGGKTGSACFDPGDAGPEWYGGMKPEEIPANVMKLTSGTMSTVAEITPGVYIFTIWSQSQCIRYDGMVKATGCCYYDYNHVLQWDPACYMGCG